MNLDGIDEKLTFGKYNGMPWSEVPDSYLVWLRERMDRKFLIGASPWGARRLYDRLCLEMKSRKLSPSKWHTI